MASDINRLIDMLFERIEDAKSPALKPNMSLVDRDEVLDLLEELRAQLRKNNGPSAGTHTAGGNVRSVLLPERFGGVPPCTFGTRPCRASPEPHPLLVLIRSSGSLRVLLLRQADAIFPEASYAVLQLWYYLITFPCGCQLRFPTKCPPTKDVYSHYMDKMDRLRRQAVHFVLDCAAAN